MRLWWSNLLDRVDALSLRERLLVLGAVLTLVAVAWDGLLMRPLERSRTQLKTEVSSLRKEVDRLDRTIAELGSEDPVDPDGGLHEQLLSTRGAVRELDQQLGGLTRGLIAPEDMVQVLRDVLDKTPPLRLISLRSLPAEPLASLVPGQMLPGRIFRHGVELELAGGYLDVLAFLRAMEQLPWRFYWQSLDLQVEQHPRLRVKLTAYTLSEEEAWIGA